MLNRLLLRFVVTLQGIASNASDEEGQTLAEYGLIMAVIAVAVIAASAVVFRGAIITAFNSATKCLGGSC